MQCQVCGSLLLYPGYESAVNKGIGPINIKMCAPKHPHVCLRHDACATSARTWSLGGFLSFSLGLTRNIAHCQFIQSPCRQCARLLCFDSTAIQLYMSLKRKFQPTLFENNITMGAKQSNMSATQKQQYHPAQKRAKPRSSSTASNTATRYNNKNTPPVANPV